MKGEGPRSHLVAEAKPPVKPLGNPNNKASGEKTWMEEA